MYHAGDQQSQHIDEQMPLAAADSLAGVIAPLGPAFRGLDRLVVEEARRW
jgi:hypothetical protein